MRWPAVAEWRGRIHHRLMSLEGIGVPKSGYGSADQPWRMTPGTAGWRPMTLSHRPGFSQISPARRTNTVSPYGMVTGSLRQVAACWWPLRVESRYSHPVGVENAQMIEGRAMGLCTSVQPALRGFWHGWPGLRRHSRLASLIVSHRASRRAKSTSVAMSASEAADRCSRMGLAEHQPRSGPLRASEQGPQAREAALDRLQENYCLFLHPQPSPVATAPP